jgi:hypothetical protein
MVHVAALSVWFRIKFSPAAISSVELVPRFRERRGGEARIEDQ